jgi:hypothetical protein
VFRDVPDDDSSPPTRIGASPAYDVPMNEHRVSMVDPQLKERLIDRFTEQVFALADLPPARTDDVRAAPEFWLANEGATLGVTCTITGSSYEVPWDGSEEAALALADEAADGTAYAATKTPYYAWLRSAR